MYWITLDPAVGQVLVKDQAEEAQARSDFAKNVKAQEALAAKQAEDERTAAENDVLAQAAMIKADRKNA